MFSCWIGKCFSEHLFSGTPPDDYFWSTHKAVRLSRQHITTLHQFWKLHNFQQGVYHSLKTEMLLYIHRQIDYYPTSNFQSWYQLSRASEMSRCHKRKQILLKLTRHHQASVKRKLVCLAYFYLCLSLLSSECKPRENYNKNIILANIAINCWLLPNTIIKHVFSKSTFNLSTFKLKKYLSMFQYPTLKEI